MTTDKTQGSSDLRASVQRYRVHWAILPKRLPDSVTGHRIGFEFELWGTHDHPLEAGPTECVECRRVRDLLERLGKHIAPTACEFRTNGHRPVDMRMAFLPRDGFGRHTCLAVEVVCRSGASAVAAQCDAGCMPGMRDKLEALGARRI
jgi:hypothetical protein